VTAAARRLLIALVVVLAACSSGEPAPPASPAAAPSPPAPSPRPVVVNAATVPPAQDAIPPRPGGPVKPAAWAGTPAGASGQVAISRLEIQELGVSAPVVDVGVLADGQLQIPSDPEVIGRWSGGAQAAAPFGALVLAGHVDTARQGPGALFRIRDLAPGALIVARDGGRAVTYRVTELRRVDKDDLVPSTDPFRQDVPHRLVLITCGGPFDRRTRHYRDNVVVLADPA
jgi:hypothetical protein